MIRASIAGLALGWLLWSGIDGAATIAIAATGAIQ